MLFVLGIVEGGDIFFWLVGVIRINDMWLFLRWDSLYYIENRIYNNNNNNNYDENNFDDFLVIYLFRRCYW